MPSVSKYGRYIYPMKMCFNVLGWLFVVLFSISAILQYNDPDPFLWMVIYGLAMLVTLGFLFKKVPSLLPFFLGILGLFGFFYVLPEKFEGFVIGGGDIKNIEEAREAFGLLIIAVVMFILAIRIRFENRSEV
ncbi:transmembrane 220 family protein [Maribacter polysiphoniae]|uniref:transmembrane 220 family protein n=1 Tax=Maribacter polysiphoniae TaxID=429344 RepID=UPI0023540777|nr:transmembrane 220 family protein [Maribacter polysiphoniae]